MFSEDDLLKLGELARIRIGDEVQLQQLRQQLGSIFEYVERLKQIDTEGVEPLSHVHGSSNIFREDVVVETDADALLELVPRRQGRFIEVPRFVNADAKPEDPNA